MRSDTGNGSGGRVFDCVGIGMCVADYQCLLERYPAADSKTEAKRFILQGGAPVPTALVALSKWKRSTAFVGIAGDDHDGRFIRDEMAECGIDTAKLMLSARARTPRAFVWIDGESGKRTVVLDRSGMKPLPARAASTTELPFCRVLHTDGRETPVAIRAMRLARKRGAQTVIDAGSPRDRMPDLIDVTDHFVASHSFVEKYFGKRVRPESALDRILALGPKAAVVTLGEHGCIGKSAEDGFFRVNGHRAKNFIVDTTGAGDVFHAGYIYGLLEGWTPRKCCEFANTAAFMSCREIGARDGISSLKEIAAFGKA
jgi:sulfofructose kinase